MTVVPSTPEAVPPQPARSTPAAVARGRILGAVLAPLRLARRRPKRFLLLSALAALALAGGAAVTLQQWFRHHLRHAQDAADQWHNAEAAKHLRDCQRVNADHPRVLLLLSRLARRTGESETAEAALQHYAALHGQDEDLAFEQFLARTQQGELADAGGVLPSILAAGGAKARLAREALTSGLMMQHRYGAVQQVLATWLAESPEDPLPFLLRGKFLEIQMGFDGAVAAYRRALDLDPELHEARLRLAHLYVSRRLGAEALAETTVLRDRLPDVPQVRVLHFKALALQGRSEESRAEIDACLRQFPDHAEALGERGSLALLAGDEAAAVADLAKAVALDPSNISARSQHALALARSGRPEDSRREYDRAKELQADSDRMADLVRGPMQKNPNDPNVLQELGAICVRAGQPREALRWFAKALEADPDHLATHKALVVLYRQLDNPVLAARHRANVQRLAPAAPKP